MEKKPIEVTRHKCPYCGMLLDSWSKCALHIEEKHNSAARAASMARKSMHKLKHMKNGPYGHGFAVILDNGQVVKGICLGIQFLFRKLGWRDEENEVYFDLYVKDYTAGSCDDAVRRIEDLNRKLGFMNGWRDSRGRIGSFKASELYPTRQAAWLALKRMKQVANATEKAAEANQESNNAGHERNEESIC